MPVSFHSRSLMPAFAAGFLIACTLVGCDPTPSPRQSTPNDGAKLTRIVVTTGMIGDLVRHVVGEYGTVTNLMGEGVDPHLFRPTAQDIGEMMQADLLFYNGLHLEGAMQGAFENAARAGRTVAAVTDGLPQELLRFPMAFEGHPDPHVWNNAGLWAKCLDQVVEVLSKHDPDHQDAFQKNAERYREQLLQIDRYARDSIATIPAESRYLVTAHDAFSYFSEAYGIKERSVQGITTESEPGVQDINNLVNFLVKNKVPALFVEATVNSANLQAVIEGAAQQDWKVTIGGTLYSDSMGAPGTYEGTYIGMIDHNVTTITRALGGEAPETGFQGKLGSTPAPK